MNRGTKGGRDTAVPNNLSGESGQRPRAQHPRGTPAGPRDGTPDDPRDGTPDDPRDGTPDDLGRDGVDDGRPRFGVEVDHERLRRELSALRDRLHEVRQTTESADGLIQVTVGARGELLDLRLDPRVLRTTDAHALAGDIMATVDRAAESVRGKLYALLHPEARAGNDHGPVVVSTFPGESAWGNGNDHGPVVISGGAGSGGAGSGGAGVRRFGRGWEAR